MTRLPAAIGAILAGLLLFVFSFLGSAHSHSFYPVECCSDRDCAPYPSSLVTETPAGYALETGEFIERKRVRFSPDGGFHLCRHEATRLILCFFVPNNGS